MIQNCAGCEAELEAVEFYSDMGLRFAGSGLYEKDTYFSNGCLKEISVFITKLYSKKDV